MAFAVSGGALAAIHRPSYQAPTSLRISPDLTQDYAQIYRTQPAVRMVCDFLARNIAQLSLQTFKRVSNNDRERVTDHPFARMMRHPNPSTTGYRLIYSMIADRAIYDRALWVKGVEADGRYTLQRIPPSMWRVDSEKSDWLAPTSFEVKGSQGKLNLSIEQVIYFRGYNPEDARGGLSPIESLQRVLSEEYAAGKMREQILRNGARVSGFITRPAGAEWSDKAYNRFREGWRGQYQGHTATEGGGTPILEDGMQFVPASQTAVDLQYIEGRKLTREETAGAYFIPPPMVGLLDHATFGNIEEQHKMLYQDTLGPWLQDTQQEIALQIISAMFPEDADDLYGEFNMLEKLRGSFEEQAAQMQIAVGAPVMTRNEARGRLNLPRIEGGDELVTPLNVLVGGQASPRDSAPKDIGELAASRGVGVSMKALAAGKRFSVKSSDLDTDQYVTLVEDTLDRFFGRQRAAVMSALGVKAERSWWDEDRWDRELTDDLYKVAVSTATELGQKQAEALGFNADDYDEDRTLAFLRSVVASRAKAVNAATRSQIDAVLAGDGEEGDDVGDVFSNAFMQRSGAGASALVAALAGFAVMEVGKQLVGDRASKTWVTGPNPRPAHAEMDGETVAISDTFSNGMLWPGDAAGGADEVAGCNCGLSMSF